VEVQKKVSAYYKEKIGLPAPMRGRPCVCNNMCYLEGTPDEVIYQDRSGIECLCYQTNYTGPMGPNVARPLSQMARLSSKDVAFLLAALSDKVARIEQIIGVK
jgi:hypothetical protein